MNLGYNYLWIDSLCIIQDSKEDWLREAALMREVYPNALLTISAANPRALEEGLSSVRHSEVIDSLVHAVRVDGNSSERKRVRISQSSKDLFTKVVSRAPIAKRAWILQEWILSHRILYFASSQLAWECDELEACELYPSGITEDASELYPTRIPVERRIWTGHAPRRALKALPHALSQSRRSARYIGLPSLVESYSDAFGSAWHTGWRLLVENYTRCDLTKASDKLIALTGVANYYRRLLLGDNPYLAGLWQKTLVEDLPWMYADTTGGCRVKEYRAPSWSWAAIDGLVMYFSMKPKEYDRRVEVIDIRTDLVDPENGTGGVRNGIAILIGKLTEACWERNLLRPREVELQLPGDGDGGYECLTGIVYSWQDDDNDTPSKVYCLTLLQKRIRAVYDGVDSWGLVMAEVQQPGRSQPESLRHFRRVGHFNAVADGTARLLRSSQDATVVIV